MSPKSEEHGQGPLVQSDERTAQLQLDRYGVIVRNVKIYLWNGYQYSNARDALAAAKRDSQI